MTSVMLCIILSFSSSVISQGRAEIGEQLRPRFTKISPEIDGKLNDPVWRTRPDLAKIFLTYHPNYGDPIPFYTKIWMAYDYDNLYFAFYCMDNEPYLIKSSINKRDAIFDDCFVGVALDTIGTNQAFYRLFINPHGIQADIYHTSAGGENVSADWLWYSHGRIVKDGYIVEIQVPLKSIRFNAGENVKMNVIFSRHISRLGYSSSWPAIDPGKGIFNSTLEIVYGKLDKQLQLEFIPSFTYSNTRERISPDRWTDPDETADFGISAKYGVTSNITVEATYNPDFSQVESDAFQVLVNQRYPYFYDEKRPFFMEANEFFDLSGPGENLWTALHTRKIVDPEWGARITGNIGKLNFGFLAAGDKSAGRELIGDANPYLDENANFYIGRAKYTMSGSNFLGTLFSVKEIGGFSNHSVGFDTELKFADNHTLEANYIHSFTKNPLNGTNIDGGGLSIEYNFRNRSLYAEAVYEYFDENFQMETAFYRRVGFSNVQGLLQHNIFPSKKKLPWFHRITLGIHCSYLYDLTTEMEDLNIKLFISMFFKKNAYLTFEYRPLDKESWVGETFEKGGLGFSSGIQLTKWLNLHACGDFDKYICYDEINPILSERVRLHFRAFFQPLVNFSQEFDYQYVNLKSESTKEKVDSYTILYSKTSFHMDSRLMFRGIVQYDSYLDSILADILVSYELIPGTVIHLGYGALYNHYEWDSTNSKWLSGTNLEEFYQTNQSLFFKVSYRLRL